MTPSHYTDRLREQFKREATSPKDVDRWLADYAQLIPMADEARAKIERHKPQGTSLLAVIRGRLDIMHEMLCVAWVLWLMEAHRDPKGHHRIDVLDEMRAAYEAGIEEGIKRAKEETDQ